MEDTPGKSAGKVAQPEGPADAATQLEADVDALCGQLHQNHRDNKPAFEIAYRRLFKAVYRGSGNAGRQRMLNTIAKHIKTNQRVEEFVGQVLSRVSAEDVTRFRSQVHRVEKLFYEAADLRIDVGSVIEARETLNFPERYRAVTAWIESLPLGAVLYDVVAGNGIRSVLAAAQPDKDVTSVAFEPGYENFAALCENIRLNELGDRVIPIHGAVGAASGRDTFHYRTLERGADQNSLAQPTDRRGNPFLPAASMTSVCWSIDDAVARLDLPAPTHLCLSTDGADLDVLVGARDALAGPGLTSVLLIGDDTAATRMREWCQETPWTPLPAPSVDDPTTVRAVQFHREVLS